MAIEIQAVPGPVYTSADGVRSGTNNSALAALSDDDLKRLIVRAEASIDFYVGFHQKYYSLISEDDPTWVDQRTIFPRVQDFRDDTGDAIPFIPTNVNQAAILLTEILFNNDVASSESASLSVLLQGADSVKIGDFAVNKKSVPKNDQTDVRESFESLMNETAEGKQVLAYLIEFQNLSFIQP